jgi:integral membrane protein
LTGPDETESSALNSAPNSAPSSALRQALLRYRVLAYIVGVGLIVLVFAGVPLQFAAHRPQVAEIVGPIHGTLYIVYLVVAADLARRSDLKVRQLILIALAGLVPFLTFVVERRITARVRSRLPESPRESA